MTSSHAISTAQEVPLRLHRSIRKRRTEKIWTGNADAPVVLKVLAGSQNQAMVAL